ncbi:hypothetical protein MMG00_07450 [Ignatzschineria rhizosphaerae]|uniref:LPS-assembly lipoprotein LptE n=1 Tax=Ignatzschineria rhizosphaerae TaxID=2923279 RepID=A0ABY3WYF8_9GAMM|nr:LPS assembly lipoprotein LptE [Ignatzschineria rhizosphaerae]UNM95075.1 hypothetical protein MMG00_07450 [Ignatzschineria rhizosphaerae]
MRLQIQAKFFVLFSVITFLVGCGFHLRGDLSFPDLYKTAYIESDAPEYSRESIEFYVKRQLASQMQFVESKNQADLIIHIDESYDTRVLASNLSGAQREYTSYLSANISVVDSQGRVVFPTESFVRSQDFSLNEREPLAKTTAEEAIKRELSEGLSRAFIRRLTTVIRAGK